jgi:hypothetical protein
MDLDIYKCLICEGQSLRLSPVEGDEDSRAAICSSCNARFPIKHNILDTTIQASPDVAAELQGMAVEAGLSAADWRSIQIRQVDSITNFGTRLQSTSSELGTQYYQQTQANFAQGIQHIGSLESKQLNCSSSRRSARGRRHPS